MPEAMGGGPGEDVGEPASRFRRWRSRRVRVEDGSMQPTLRPGDRLLVDTGAYRHRPPGTGEIVVLVDPEAPSRWLVKRVSAVDPARGTLEVRGDATDVARDSRTFGPVPTRSIVGRVYRRYYPPERRGEL
ncbi:MAG: nickel-type superoxide dismutase maturation protease [Thermoplasmata archaeon]|nr:nickel-type superoxide dismutase maturation protease [Thermoplasmata archaeon]